MNLVNNSRLRVPVFRILTIATTALIIFVSFQVEIFSVETIDKQKGSYLDKIRFIHYLDENVALEEIKSGNLDTYYFRIPLDLVSDIKKDESIKLYDKISGTFGILLNPAPPQSSSSSSDIINPFQFQEVRFAMNFLVNRNFIANELLHGYGIPIYDPTGQYSPDYPIVMNTVESFGFHYDQDYAYKEIKRILLDNGAKLINGKWFFKDKPITVKILIRSDDLQRKALGELISSELQQIGFRVVKDYSDLNKATTIIQGSDPQQFLWHVYTEAFAGTSSFVRYNDGALAQMYAPWYANMPGNRNPGFWQYENSTLNLITQKLVFSNFTSENERNKLFDNATNLGIQESVRIFLVKNIDPYAVSSSITGMINDFGAGIPNKYSLLNAKSIEGNSMMIGVKQIYQGAWNTVGGLGDTYSISIYSNLADSATLRHPYTGEVISMRNQILNVTANPPNSALSVHPDAIVWDSVSSKWLPVGNHAKSQSKATYKILYSDWHNGIPMDKSDLLYSIYFMYEWGSNNGKDDLTVDPEYTSKVGLSLPYFKGIRFISHDIIESYLDQWHYDKNEIAASAGIWAQEPWEITAAIERLVLSNELSFSKSQAITKNSKWLSLIIPEDANLIKQELIKMKNENFIPSPLKGIVKPDEATKRFAASIKWIEEHKHALISNGPFFLDTYNPSGRTIDIRSTNDNSYPFELGYWSNFENPKSIQIKNIDSSKFIKIGQEKIIQFQVLVDNNISNSVINNTFFLTDYNGKILFSGTAKSSTEASWFQIILDREQTKKIPFGPSSLKIFSNTKDSLRPTILANTYLGIK